jgi:hypothetical protein
MKGLPQPTWSELSAIGQAPIAKVSILMPFIGYIILLQEGFIALITPFGLGTADGVKVGVSFYLLYFGLILFGLGSFVFHVACPPSAKKFVSADDYVERLQELVTASELSTKLDKILSGAEAGSLTAREASLYRDTVLAGISNIPNKAMIAFTLREYFYLQDKCKKIARLVVLILFSVGIILTLIPSLMALVRVWMSFSKSYL